MIFDTIAANGGERKYLFKDGVYFSPLGAPQAQDNCTDVSTTADGLVLTSKSHSGGIFYIHACFDNYINFSPMRKIYVAFDAFTLKEGVNSTYVARTGFYLTKDDLNYGFLDNYIVRTPVARNNNPFIVEIDVSKVTRSGFIQFYAACSSPNDNSPLGGYAKIHSIWYV